jgi:hypothetical protein
VRALASLEPRERALADGVERVFGQSKLSERRAGEDRYAAARDGAETEPRESWDIAHNNHRPREAMRPQLRLVRTEAGRIRSSSYWRRTDRVGKPHV